MTIGLRVFVLLLLAPIVAIGCGRSNPPSGDPPTAAAADLASAADAGAGAAPETAPPETASAASVLPQPELGYNARQGRVLFLHYCATCHGAEGHGDGFNAYNLDPKPRDLGEPSFQAQHSDDELAVVVRSGGGAAGLSNGMPPWGRTLGERQVRNLVAFVRTLKPAEP